MFYHDLIVLRLLSNRAAPCGAHLALICTPSDVRSGLHTLSAGLIRSYPRDETSPMLSLLPRNVAGSHNFDMAGRDGLDLNVA